jgi:hypothetical protein
MSLFSWLFPDRRADAQAESSGLSRMDSTRPVGKGSGAKEESAGNAQPANRKSERMARREVLYAVVREAMMRAGVLSASYKFKVLSLDARGRQFLVMVDLARDTGGETERLAEIEAAIAQTAKSRYDIVVSAVYWRTNEHVAEIPAISAARKIATGALILSRGAHGASSAAPGPARCRRARRSPADLRATNRTRPTRSRLPQRWPRVANCRRGGGIRGAGRTGQRAVDGAVARPQSYTLLTISRTPKCRIPPSARRPQWQPIRRRDPRDRLGTAGAVAPQRLEPPAARPASFILASVFRPVPGYRPA